MPFNTLLAQKLIDRFREMVDKLYKEPEHPVIVGSYLESESLDQSTLHPRQPSKKNKPTKKASKTSQVSPSSRGGIRYYMLKGSSEHGASGSGLPPKKKPAVVELSDSDSD